MKQKSADLGVIQATDHARGGKWGSGVGQRSVSAVL